MNLTKPALLAAVAYLVMALVILLPFNIGEYDPEYATTKKYNLGYRMLLLLVMVIPIALSIYSINCFIVGKCVVWGWINSIVVCLWVILFITATFVSSERFVHKST